MSLLQVRVREVLVLCTALIAGLILLRIVPAGSPAPALTAAERGRQVYVSEGCISCHSQYVRPGTPDELMWGPAQTMQQIHAQKPPLIGNRRQGPDLTQVGQRRSPLWLKAHLIAPAELSGSSIMPSYALLFADERGEDLVAYLSSLRGPNAQEHLQQEKAWRPSAAALQQASRGEGEGLYAQECMTCHDRRGAARVPGHVQFKKLPSDLATLRAASDTYSPAHFAQIVKFGIPGTDMPGHEYLSDRQVASLILWLTPHSAQTLPHS